MGLFSFFSKKPVPAPLPDAAAQAPRAAPAVDEPIGPPMLCRQAILDEAARLCGYRFVFAGGDPALAIDEAAFFEAVGGAGIPELAAKRFAVIPFTLEAIAAKRHLPLIAPGTVFLIDREQAHVSAQQLATRLRALREWGCKVALRGVSLDPQELPLLEVCDVVVLHLDDAALPQFQAMTHQLNTLYPTLKIAADGVRSWEEQRMCAAWGCQYFMGGFVLEPDRLDGAGQIHSARVAAAQLFNLLSGGAELDALAALEQQAPRVAAQVLEWAKAWHGGPASNMASLGAAVAQLGRTQVARLALVAMFGLGDAAGRDSALLELALARARFLETIEADALATRQREELFQLGLLSLFDSLLRLPMALALETLHLPDATRDALVRDAGPYAAYLDLLRLSERGASARAAHLAEQLAVSAASLAPVGAAAFAWAQAARVRAR